MAPHLLERKNIETEQGLIGVDVAVHQAEGERLVGVWNALCPEQAIPEREQQSKILVVVNGIGAVVELMPMRTQNHVIDGSERDSKMRVTDEIKHENVSHDVDVDPEDRDLDGIERDQRPDPEADSWDEAVPGPVHQFIERMNAVLRNPDHDFRRVVDLVQFPQERNAMLRDVIEIIGNIVGDQHRDGKDDDGDRARSTRQQRLVNGEQSLSQNPRAVGDGADKDRARWNEQKRRHQTFRHPEHEIGLGRGRRKHVLRKHESQERAGRPLAAVLPIGQCRANDRRR